MNIYKTTDNLDLIRLLEQFEILTYEAKNQLAEEINYRKLKVDVNKFNLLKTYLKNRNKELNHFTHLDKIGFSYIEHSQNSFEINRLNRAKNGNLLSGVIGFFLIGISILIFTQLYIWYKQNEFDYTLIKISSIILFIILFRYGIEFVINSFKRLENYSNFKFLIEDNKVTLNKKVNSKLVQIQKPVNLLILEKSKKEVCLKLEGIEIFKIIDPNLKDAKTVEAIYNNAITR